MQIFGEIKMTIFGWKGNKFRILGIPVLLKELSRGGCRYSLFGVPVFFVSNQLLEIQTDFSLKVPLEHKYYLDDQIQSSSKYHQFP